MFSFLTNFLRVISLLVGFSLNLCDAGMFVSYVFKCIELFYFLLTACVGCATCSGTTSTCVTCAANEFLSGTTCTGEHCVYSGRGPWTGTRVKPLFIVYWSIPLDFFANKQQYNIDISTNLL